MKSSLEDREYADPKQFKLKKHLGTGGFAHTFLAQVLDVKLIEKYGTDRVVLKIPNGPNKQMALNDEIELNAALHMRLKSINSPNLCRYLGFNVFRRDLVMVMEYCSGGSLRKILGMPGFQKRLPVEYAIQIAQGVLGGLIIIHNERIFHRDIKPENILMDEEKTPKVSDLGISKMLGSVDQASSTVGTLHYMSPEMLGSEGASFPADIWSMGVTLYEMVTGRWPFGDPETPMGVMADLIRRETQEKPCEVCSDVPSWLSDLIDIALKKNAADRFHSAAEMLEALSRAEQRPDLFEKEAAEVKELMQAGETGARMDEALRRLAEKFPENAQVYHYFGQYYNRCQLRREAADAFQKGLKLDRNNALLHWDLALACQGMGRTLEAVEHIERALELKLDPKLQEYAKTMLKALRASGAAAPGNTAPPQKKLDQFEQDLAQARELMNAEECNQNLATELRRLTQKYPNNPHAYQHLGEYYNRCHMHREAVVAFQRGIELDNGNALLHWDLALAYQRLGRKPEAVKHLEKALALDLDPGLRQHADILLRTLRLK